MTDNAITQTVVLAAGAPASDHGTNPSSSPMWEAFDQALPKAQLLKPHQLVTINLDLPSVIITCLGVAPKLLALREQAVALPGFDIAAFDELRTYAYAAAHAHSLYMGVSGPPELLLKLNERAMALRNLLCSDAEVLAKRNIIHGDRIGALRASVGYKNLAFDLLAVVEILHSNWDKIAGRTAIQPAELQEAALLGQQLVYAVGRRERVPENVAQVTLQRQQLFTLLLNTYSEARRAVSYLRWHHGDADTIAPSLYAGRVSKRKKANSSPPSSPPPPVAAPDNGVAHNPLAASVHAQLNAHAEPTEPAEQPAQPIPVGLPGSSPFMAI